MQRRLKNGLISTTKILFSALLIGWLIRSGKLDFTDFSTLSQPWLILSGLFLVGTNLVLCSERWRLILTNQGLFTSFANTMKLSLIGVFFNYFVPGGVGGDVVKGYYLAKENPTQKMKSVVTIAMDRLLGLFNLLLMALAAMTIKFGIIMEKPELLTLFGLLVALFIGFMIFWIIIFSRRIDNHGLIEKLILLLPFAHKMMNLYKSFASYNSSKKTFFQAMVFSFIAQLLTVGLFVLIGEQLGFHQVQILDYFFVVPIGLMVQAVPISPGGIGVGQAAFYYLFYITTGAESSIGATAITAIQILQFIYGLIGAGFYVTIRREMPKLEPIQEGNV